MNYPPPQQQTGAPVAGYAQQQQYPQGQQQQYPQHDQQYAPQQQTGASVGGYPEQQQYSQQHQYPPQQQQTGAPVAGYPQQQQYAPPQEQYQQQYPPQQQQYPPQQQQYPPQQQYPSQSQQGQYPPQQGQYPPQQQQYPPQQQGQYPQQQQQYPQQQQQYPQGQYQQQQQQPYNPHMAPGMVQPADVPLIDPQLKQQVMNYITHATPGQFKPNKIYVLFNCPTSQKALQVIRNNNEVDQLVEVVNVAYPQNRPQWLKGVPTVMDENQQIFQGTEALQWVMWQNSQTLSAFNESSGVSQILPGMPAAMDGTAGMSGSLSETSFVPQQMVSDQDMMRSMGQGMASQRYDSMMSSRRQVPQIRPPQGWNPQQGMPEASWTQQVDRGGHAEELNRQMESVQQDRNALLMQQRMPHMAQRKMGWNPIVTEKVTRGGRESELNQRLEQYKMDRQQTHVPFRRMG